MTTHLYCHECGWRQAYRRKCGAHRADADHHCTGTLAVSASPSWWTRLWTILWASLRGAPSNPTADVDSSTQTGLPGCCGDRIQRAVLAAHHTETARRSRQAMIELVRAGYQIGPPPYGYRALHIRVTDPTGHSKIRAVLSPHWQTAAVVKQIFLWRADHGLRFATIADCLNRDPHRYPAPKLHGRWTGNAVRRIVTNVKYTGCQVWARTVAGRPAPVGQWITSQPKVHEPLVDERTFHRAQPAATRLPPGWTDPSDAPASAA